MNIGISSFSGWLTCIIITQFIYGLTRYASSMYQFSKIKLTAFCAKCGFASSAATPDIRASSVRRHIRRSNTLLSQRVNVAGIAVGPPAVRVAPPSGARLQAAPPPAQGLPPLPPPPQRYRGIYQLLLRAPPPGHVGVYQY